MSRRANEFVDGFGSLSGSGKPDLACDDGYGPSASPAACEEQDSVIDLLVKSVGGEELRVILNANATLSDLKDAVAQHISIGGLAVNFCTEAGTILNVDAVPLAELGVANNEVLVMATESARDYTKISGSEMIISCTRHPLGVLITPTGDTLVTHYYGELSIYDHTYEKVKEYNLPGRSPEQMALAPTKELLIVFCRSPYSVGVFDSEIVDLRHEKLEVRRWIGESLSAPEGVAVAGVRMFISEGPARGSKGSVSIYSLTDGELLQKVSDGFNNPRGLAIVDDIFLAVADRRNNRVVLLSVADLQPVGQIPSKNDSQFDSQLSDPNDVAVDSGGNLLVMDVSNNRIAVFRQDGTFLASVLPGVFSSRGNTCSYIACNCTTGAIAATDDDGHKMVVLSPIFEQQDAVVTIARSSGDDAASPTSAIAGASTFRAAATAATAAISTMKVTDGTDGVANCSVESEDADAMAKAYIMDKCVALRQKAAQVVKSNGGDWSKLSWTERLRHVQKQETRGRTVPKGTSSSHIGAREPPPEPSSRSDHVNSGHQANKSEAGIANPVGPSEQSEGTNVAQKAASETITRSRTDDDSVPVTTKPKPEIQRRRSSGLGPAMTRGGLVDYSLSSEDIRIIVGPDQALFNDALSFKRSLKTAGDPSDLVTVSKYIAKGTIGWIFLAAWKATREKVVLKLVRFSQANFPLREWCVSKLLRNAQIPNVVLTDEAIRVVVRDQASSVIEAELKAAGPVNFYVCLFQEYMNGGTLEDLLKEDRISLDLMFKVLTDVSSTLALMHATGLHHKDLKPENVLLEVKNGTVVAAKLGDFGSAEIGHSEEGRADDIRRFGLMMFSLATGEAWTEKGLIHEDHAALISRLSSAVNDVPDTRVMQLPQILEQLLNVNVDMQRVAALMKTLS